MEERIPEFFGQKLLISSLLNNIYLSIEHVQTTNALTLCLDVNIHLAKTHFTNFRFYRSEFCYNESDKFKCSVDKIECKIHFY